MKEEKINGKTYRLPGSLTKFQKEMYIQLINYKWNVLKIKDPGIYRYKEQDLEYDAILPKSVHKKYPLIYPEVLSGLLEHQKKHYFKLHLHFNHMASSQAANVNLFLPLLLNTGVDAIFRQLKPDFDRLAKDQLFHGFRIEFWAESSTDDKGLLGDHNARSGTDSDIAIAYYNSSNELCLWLIEHKLTEKEFTTCGGYKSKDNPNKHLCDKSFSDIVENKNLCFYHYYKKTEYWNITEKNQSFFANHKKHESCPFKGGINQLWRNQLLALALENTEMYKHVYFSVVHHPGNKALNRTIEQYQELIDSNQKFSVSTSDVVVEAAKKQNIPELIRWADWYCGLYKI